MGILDKFFIKLNDIDGGGTAVTNISTKPLGGNRLKVKSIKCSVSLMVPYLLGGGQDVVVGEATATRTLDKEIEDLAELESAVTGLKMEAFSMSVLDVDERLREEFLAHRSTMSKRKVSRKTRHCMRQFGAEDVWASVLKLKQGA